MCEALFFSAPKFPHSPFSSHMDMFGEPHVSYTEGEMSISPGGTCSLILCHINRTKHITTSGAQVGGNHALLMSPRSLLDRPKVDVPLNSPPPLRSTFLVWNPETKGLEYANQLSPASPHFGGRSRLLSEVSTVSTASTDSSGLYGDASDREDDAEDVAAPPVPPPTPFTFKGDDVPNADPVEGPEVPPLPAAATIEYLDRPPVSSRSSTSWKGSKDNLYKSQSFDPPMYASVLMTANSETLQVLS